MLREANSALRKTPTKTWAFLGDACVWEGRAGFQPTATPYESSMPPSQPQRGVAYLPYLAVQLATVSVMM